MIREIQDEILRLKKEKDVCILAHSYQPEAICEIADFTGDSYALAVKAAKTENKTVIMCGVRFMAEGVKLLCPDKKVLLSHPQAGCPMAEQFTAAQIEAFRKENPDTAVVAYINTTADIKTVCDVCVTSSSAVNIVKKVENDNILFIPDCNLGRYVADRVPEKNITLWKGGCPIHGSITVEEAKAARAKYPNALFLVHPECVPEISDMADMAGSTAEIMDYAQNSSHGEFIIGTEVSIVEHLQIACPEKKFYPLTPRLVCGDMKLTTLTDVLGCLNGTAGEEIVLSDETVEKGRRCIQRMIDLG